MRSAIVRVLLVAGLALGVVACGGDDDDDDVSVDEAEEEVADEDEDAVEDESMTEDGGTDGDAAVAASACGEFSSTTINAENAAQFREIADEEGMPSDLAELLHQLVDAAEADDQEAAAALFPEIDALCTQYMAEAGG